MQGMQIFQVREVFDLRESKSFSEERKVRRSSRFVAFHGSFCAAGDGVAEVVHRLFVMTASAYLILTV